MLDLKAQYQNLKEELGNAVIKVLESQHFILGPEVEALEKEIGAYSQSKFGIGVSSGTDALLVSLMALDIKSGDEVITTDYSFFATAGVIARLGARPVFVDIEPETYNLDPDQVEKKITKKTRALIPVHLYGQCADMDSLFQIAQKYELAIIEDAAQALGAEYKKQRAGSMGIMGCFSFFPSKNLGGAGDGGMVVTHDAKIAERLAILRNHGAHPKYYHKIIGGNFRLDALQAAILRVKLKYLEAWTIKRQQNGENYRKLFQDYGLTDRIKLPIEKKDQRHIYNQFVIASEDRDRLKGFLVQKNIGTEIYYPVPFHAQQCFHYLRNDPKQFPQSISASKTTLALPIYPELTFDQQRYVVEMIQSFYQDFDRAIKRSES